MKSTLRKVYLRKRKTLTDKEYNRRNDLILKYFQDGLPSFKNLFVHVFLSIEKQREVQTWPIIECIKKQGGTVVISRSDTNSNKMEHFQLDENTVLHESKWGILEPTSGRKIDVTDIDVVLVPLIVADKHGGRIGYGKGYYDRFLAGCRPDIQKIGLSLSPLLDKIQNLEPFDVPLDSCIYPGGMYGFKQ